MATTPREKAQIDRLLKEFTQKAQALAIVADLINQDSQHRAEDTLPKKLRAAAKYRAQARPAEEAEVTVTPPKPVKRQKTRQPRLIASGSRDELKGDRMLLFLLEHFDTRKPTTAKDIRHALGVEGYVMSKMFSRALGALTDRKWATRKEKEYKLTWNGKRGAAVMRAKMEKAGVISKGSYRHPLNGQPVKPKKRGPKMPAHVKAVLAEATKKRWAAYREQQAVVDQPETAH